VPAVNINYFALCFSSPSPIFPPLTLSRGTEDPLFLRPFLRLKKEQSNPSMCC